MTHDRQADQTPAARSLEPTGYPYAPQSARLPKPKVNEPWTAPSPPAYLAVVLIVLGCLAFNAFVPAVIIAFRPEPVPLVAFTFGMFWSELGVLCAALVFSEARFWLRMLVVWTIGYGLEIAFLAGLWVSAPYPPDIGEALRVLFCGLPLVALAAQLPLWAARFYFGWRIMRPGEAESPPRPLSIGDILCGTAIAAVTLGVVRFVPGPQQRIDIGFWIGWAIAVPAIAGISLISVLPALFLMLRIEKQAQGCAVAVIYAVIAAVATPLVMAAIIQQPMPDEVVLVFPIMICTFGGLLCGAFGLARRRGYRLVFPRDCWIGEQPTAHEAER